PPASLPSLNGDWQDAQGGRYRLTEQGGGGFRFEGLKPYGQMGIGWIANNILTLDYTFNGVRYGAELEISADGNWLRGRYGSAVTGENGPVVLQRIR
ncbi:MAG: hypothetical protein ACSLE5_16010, partial [Porticoccaceae bacterium]